MPGLTLRGFECNLCGQEFTLLAGDLYVPQPRVCDACVLEVWEMDDDVLTRHVAQCLAGEGEMPADRIVQDIGWQREQWKSAEELIAQRERERGVPG